MPAAAAWSRTLRSSRDLLLRIALTRDLIFAQTQQRTRPSHYCSGQPRRPAGQKLICARGQSSQPVREAVSNSTAAPDTSCGYTSSWGTCAAAATRPPPHMQLATLAVLVCAAAGCLAATPTAVRLPTGRPFVIGWAAMNMAARQRVIWVDPALGNDTNSGATQDKAVKTFTRAWNMVRARAHVHSYLAGEGGWSCPLQKVQQQCHPGCLLKLQVHPSLHAGASSAHQALSYHHPSRHISAQTRQAVPGEGTRQWVGPGRAKDVQRQPRQPERPLLPTLPQCPAGYATSVAATPTQSSSRAKGIPAPSFSAPT